MSDTIKAVVIGAGQIARQHLACLRGIRSAEIAGVCDLSPAVAESTAERFGARAWFTDHRKMLTDLKPAFVHITTPVNSHYSLASDALNAGCNVIVEKPVTVTFEELTTLQALAAGKGLALIEDYNYLFNAPVLRVLSLIRSGEFGEVTHTDVEICLNLLSPGSPFADKNAPHPSLKTDGGAIADFLPHLASLANLFIGAHRSVRTVWSKQNPASPLPSDEFRALVRGEKAAASLFFSVNTQPDAFRIRVFGTKMRAAISVYDKRFTVDRVRGGPKALTSFFNALAEARAVRRSAFSSVWDKLSGGPGVYEGLWELVRRAYEAHSARTAPPVTSGQITEVNRLIRDLKSREFMI